MAERVCPVWVGYFLASPMRKLVQNPDKILSPYVEEGMKVLDIGCAMGFFSLPLARMVGSTGKVICIDLQEKMIRSIEKRAKKAGLSDRVDTLVCSQNSLGLNNYKDEIDFAIAFALVHEVPDAPRLFSEVSEVLKPTGKILVSEPKGHVSAKDFEVTISIAEQNGLKRIEAPQVKRSRTALFKKIPNSTP